MVPPAVLCGICGLEVGSGFGQEDSRLRRGQGLGEEGTGGLPLALLGMKIAQLSPQGGPPPSLWHPAGARGLCGTCQPGAGLRPRLPDSWARHPGRALRANWACWCPQPPPPPIPPPSVSTSRINPLILHVPAAYPACKALSLSVSNFAPHSGWFPVGDAEAQRSQLPHWR